MEERKRKQKSSEIEETDPGYLLYTSESNHNDIVRFRKFSHLRVDSSLRAIPCSAFGGNVALVQVQLPETLKEIGDRAFDRCCNLKIVQFYSDASLGSLSINPCLVEDGMIVFPEKANLQIHDYAFGSCESLRKVIVCSISTKLASDVFCGCTGLISVQLPEGLQVIASSLFFHCKLLETVNIPSSVIKIHSLAFYSCSSLPSVDLPHGLMEIGQLSFASCESLETLHIPATVSSIGKGAFDHCGRLKYIKLPPTLERIELGTFSKCYRLEYMEIPSTVAFIGWRAFWHCRSLSHIRIPSRVDCLLYSSFRCDNLISLELPEGLSITIAGLNQLDSYQDFDCPSLVNLAFPALTKDLAGLKYLRESKLGSVAGGNNNLGHKLEHRFDNSPLHKLCYYQSYHSSEDLILRLRSLMEDDPLAATVQVDAFGMTPLHILSLSQVPNMDMMLALISAGHPDHIIHCKDPFGSTPMGYLCLNRMPNATQVIRRVIQTRLDKLGLDRWKLEMMQAVHDALAVDWSLRMREIGRVYFKLAKYERKEVLSLMELYLWKMKNGEFITAQQNTDRESCRINSGASIVIPQVLPFLPKVDMEDYDLSTS
eukprot:scaffold4658_cov118-Cylindrotheca_fusiformis.AAC.6